MSGRADCFHCGESVPDGPPITAHLDGIDRPMCCIGCKAVAEFIDSSGLSAFYDHRDNPAAERGLTPEATDWGHYDQDSLLNRYVHKEGDLSEATIDIGGMYCSACVWLLDNALKQVDGIDSMAVNPATRRAVIRWESDGLPFSELLAAIARVGFKPAPISATEASPGKDEDYRLALKRLIVAAVAGMQVMMFAVALYAGDFFGIEGGMEKFLRTISLLVTLPIVFYSARPFFTAAWRGLRALSPGMDLPVSLAILGAFLASTYAALTDRGEVYFDSVAMFVFFLGATRFLEMRARHRSEDHSLALARLLPDWALRVQNRVTEKVAIDVLRPGDLLSIRPGDVLPADGTIETGALSVDESMLTGESLPVDRQPGDPVFAGAVVRTGNAFVRLTRTGASTSLAEIGRMLERAKADRPPVALLADRIASKFVVGVLVLATAAGTFWAVTEPDRAFAIALATLVVTCPCALALATPAAIAAATSRLARSGFLLVRSRVLEVINRATVFVFDKTGTLTEGRPTVIATEGYGAAIDEASLRSLAAAIESASEHVLARAFEGFEEPGRFIVDEARVVPGAGVEASVDNCRYRIGNAAFVADLGSYPAPESGAGDSTSVFLGDSTGILARFDIGDELRADAAQSVARLRSMGYRPLIASGDRAPAVARAARRLGIDDWQAGLNPAAKLALIHELRAGGETVVMVGDGINDAPVLAAADASVALDAGTALARASADAVSLGHGLGTLVAAVAIARKTQTIIRQNIAWAIVYNVTAVPLAVSGLLAPWMAALGMSASSLLVVLNALRLHRAGSDDSDNQQGTTAARPDRVQAQATT